MRPDPPCHASTVESISWRRRWRSSGMSAGCGLLATARPRVSEGSRSRRGLRLLAPLDRLLKGPEKYRILDLKRRRAQIRARRELAGGLGRRRGLCQLELTDDDPGRAPGVALMPPEAFPDPPAVLTLIIEQLPAAGADVVIKFRHVSGPVCDRRPGSRCIGKTPQHAGQFHLARGPGGGIRKNCEPCTDVRIWPAFSMGAASNKPARRKV